MKTTLRRPTPPGEILQEEFVEPLGLTQEQLARGLGVTRRRVNEIINGRRGITADTAIRLGRFFGMSAQFWLNLQQNLDFWEAEHRGAQDYDKVKPYEEFLRENS